MPSQGSQSDMSSSPVVRSMLCHEGRLSPPNQNKFILVISLRRAERLSAEQAQEKTARLSLFSPEPVFKRLQERQMLSLLHLVHPP